MTYTPTTKSIAFKIPATTSPSNLKKLSLRIHGIEYPGQVTVQINSSAIVSISDATVELSPKEIAFGGVGGGFHTLDMTIPLAAGSLVSGTNTIHFTYTGTDETNSGVRILGINFLDASGTALFNSKDEQWVDPKTWVGPRTDASTIAQGKTLFQTANLIFSPKNKAIMKAKCASCHAQDGRDLEYYSYSNESIITRSTFHGLTPSEGEAIASYIRSLSGTLSGVGRYGRPWNPPYQPGPGLDAKPVEQWAAGAGLEGVLVDDNAMEPYLFPGGSTKYFDPSVYINMHEIPLSWQLQDWNHWLPTIHPLDGFGDAWVKGVPCPAREGNLCSPQLGYDEARTELKVGDAASFANSYGMYRWGLDTSIFQTALVMSVPIDEQTGWADHTMAEKAQSLVLFNVVKLWEVMHEFKMEDKAVEILALKGKTAANPRSWVGPQFPFVASPNFAHIPVQNFKDMGNKTVGGRHAMGHQWYFLQMAIGDGDGYQEGTGPIDYPYLHANVVNDNDWGGHIVSVAYLETFNMLKALRTLHTTERMAVGAVRLDMWAGWMMGRKQWVDVDLPHRQKILDNFLKAFIKEIDTRTVADFTDQDRSFPSATQPVDPSGNNYPSEIAFALPSYKMLGADVAVLNQIADWAKTIYPNYNWRAAVSAPCSLNGAPADTGMWVCSIPGY